MSTTSKQITDVNAHGSNVSTGFTTQPEDTHISLLVVIKKLRFINSSYSQFLLDGRNERRSLEARSSQILNGFLKSFDFINMLMQFNDGNVLFTSRLLSFHKSSGVIDANNQASCNLRIKCTTVTY